jgi:predicted deacylase
MSRIIKIGQHEIAPGEELSIDVDLAKLPTRTDITIPVVVSRAQADGPTVLLIGGMHGNEINGVEIVRRFIANGLNRPQRGTTICIPIINVFGFLHFSREVPDGKDVNRSFPGTRSGSLASQIAYYLRSEIIPLIDVGIDFHTGGARINNFPQVRVQMNIGNNLELATQFATRFVINSRLRDKSFRKEAQKQGKPILVYEGGESLRLRKNAIDEGLNGALRVMKHLGMIDTAPESSGETIIIESSTWVRAKVAGLFYTTTRLGSKITRGSSIGYISGPFGDFQQKVKSTVEGYIVAINNNPVVNKGDALVHVGMPKE